MNKYLFVLLALVLGSGSYSSADAQGIRYRFSREVEHAVDSVLTRVAARRDYDDYFLMVYALKDVNYISIFKVDPTSISERHYLKETNRYAIVGGKRIKVLSGNDVTFGVWEAPDGSDALIRTQLLDGIEAAIFDNRGRLIHR